MLSPNAFRIVPRAALARLLAVFLAVLFPTAAFADTKQECSSAYDQTQALRQAGRLQDAHRQAALCTRDVCKDFIRSDCTKWLAEIEAAQPTAVVAVKDTAGRDATTVKIMLDGRPWLDRLDGTAKPIDPGKHTLRYAIDGAAPLDDTVLIREGEKNRSLKASFQKGIATSSGGAPGGDGARSQSPGPWIIGGIGVGVLVAGAVTGGLVLSDKSTTNQHCSSATRTCDATGESAASQGRVLGPVTTGALAVGGAALATGIIWLVVDRTGKRQSSASFVVVPVVTGHTGALVVEGAW